MPPERFEPAIPASDRPQTHALDRADIRIGLIETISNKYWEKRKIFAVKGVEIGDAENSILVYHPRLTLVSLSPGKHGGH